MTVDPGAQQGEEALVADGEPQRVQQERAASDDPTRAWVRKEALLKAYGLGLAVDPSQVRLDDDGLAAWDSSQPPPGEVWVRDIAVPGHVAAVAVLPDAVHDLAGLAVTVRPPAP